MKKQILAIAATLSIVVTLTITCLASLNTKVMANIPFDFMVSGKTLPAGSYTVSPGTSKGTLTIRSADSRVAIGVIAMDATEKSKGKARLIFRRYGNQHFLAQVFDGYSGGQELLKSKAEREAAKPDHLAMRNATPEIVTISAQAGQ